MPLSPEKIDAIRQAQEAQAQQAEPARQDSLADGCEVVLDATDAAVSGASLVSDLLSALASLLEA